MVPAIVRQCIYVIDKFGLDQEGIYRKSANVLDVSKLKEEIDKDPANISMILPSKPHSDSDIYLVGSLLKTFLRRCLIVFYQRPYHRRSRFVYKLKTQQQEKILCTD